MKQCQCGGVLREHELTDGKIAYACHQCGRYQALPSRATPADEQLAMTPQAIESERLGDMAGVAA